jgi:hypothetical protein
MTLNEYSNKNVIVYHSTKNGLTINQTHDLFEQLKLFLYDCSISQERLNPTKEVDSIWHSFILHTEEYAEFCHSFFHKFIHHLPSSTNQYLGTIYADLYADCSSVKNIGRSKLVDCQDGAEA